MTASKGFNLDYRPSQLSYKKIYMQDPQCTEKLQEQQQKRGSDLPDTFLSAEYVQQKAKKLFYTL